MADTLTLATFNLHNLQEAGLPVYGDPPRTAAQVEGQVRWTGAMLRRLDADVVGVQELWHPAPLIRAVAEAGLAGSHEVLFDPAAPPGDRITCGAVLRRGRFDPARVTWIEAFPPAFRLETEGHRASAPGMPRGADPAPVDPPFGVSLTRFSRPVLRLSVDAGAGRPEVLAFVCHLKSRNPTPIDRDGWYDAALHGPHRDAIGAALSTVRRTAEAAALRILLTEATRGNRTPVALMGDLNDGQETSTLAILTEQPRLSDASRGPTDEGGALYSVQSIEEARSLRDVFYTYIYRGIHSSLDNILVSQEFYDFSRLRTWVLDELRIFNDHLSRRGPAFGAPESDHGAVAARFAWRPAVAPAA